MKKNIDFIPDPTPEDGFEGLYCGIPGIYDDEPFTFDLRAAAKYVRENKLDRITDEIKEMFRK